MAYRGERSFSDVFQDIVGNVQNIIRSEVRLAKAEVKEEAGKALTAARILAAGAVLGLFAVGFLLLTLTRALETTMSPWLASLIVALLTGLLSFTGIQMGRARWQNVHPTPGKTIQTIKENIEWMKGPMK